jgi:erythromycin esterase-like protein
VTPVGDRELALAILARTVPLRGERSDWDPLLARIGGARFVLLGEATHGTHDFYKARAEITKRLILEKGFVAVAAEADWPDARRVDRFVRSTPGIDDDAASALASFRRFPQWMWRNADVLDFVGWLRDRGRGRAGFYGLDLYSLHASIAAVLHYLDHVDPGAAALARERYACFEDFGPEPRPYSCEDEVVAVLLELQQWRAATDEFFSVEQDARVVRDAGAYYRGMFGGRVSSWNLRDTHMADTLDAIAAHLGPEAKIVVWAHNSHVGDARHTELRDAGELNLGQLVRERHPGEAVLVGFTTHAGTVSAAASWDGPVERMRVREAIAGSVERLFHEVALPRFLLDLGDLGDARALAEPRLERAIGVVYKPESERHSHYFSAVLPGQFDVVVHLDETRAVEPLERTAGWEGGVPETYPVGV